VLTAKKLAFASLSKNLRKKSGKLTDNQLKALDRLERVLGRIFPHVGSLHRIRYTI
jgi:hypothetical protein